MEHTRGHRPRGRQTVGIVSFLGMRTALFGISLHGPDTLLISVGRRHDLPPVSVNAYSSLCRFLGIVDKLGAAYEENFVSTSFGLYFCLPLMRSLYRENMTEEEARAVLEECARVGYYRNCLATNRVGCGDVG